MISSKILFQQNDILLDFRSFLKQQFNSSVFQFPNSLLSTSIEAKSWFVYTAALVKTKRNSESKFNALILSELRFPLLKTLKSVNRRLANVKFICETNDLEFVGNVKREFAIHVNGFFQIQPPNLKLYFIDLPDFEGALDFDRIRSAVTRDETVSIFDRFKQNEIVRLDSIDISKHWIVTPYNGMYYRCIDWSAYWSCCWDAICSMTFAQYHESRGRTLAFQPLVQAKKKHVVHLPIEHCHLLERGVALKRVITGIPAFAEVLMQLAESFEKLEEFASAHLPFAIGQLASSRWIRDAFTSESFGNQWEIEPPLNQKLEFIGDAVLDLLCAEALYQVETMQLEPHLIEAIAALKCRTDFTSIADLAHSLVCNSTLDFVAKELAIASCCLGIGLLPRGAVFVEALVGAIFMENKDHAELTLFFRTTILPLCCRCVALQPALPRPDEQDAAIPQPAVLDSRPETAAQANLACALWKFIVASHFFHHFENANEHQLTLQCNYHRSSEFLSSMPDGLLNGLCRMHIESPLRFSHERIDFPDNYLTNNVYPSLKVIDLAQLNPFTLLQQHLGRAFDMLQYEYHENADGTHGVSVKLMHKTLSHEFALTPVQARRLAARAALKLFEESM